jgi:hypothetical protein
MRYIAGATVLAAGALAAVALVIPPALAAPATPPFGPAIDAYAPRALENSCQPDPKPGVLGWRDLLNATYGPHTAYTYPANGCTSGSSEHEDGRALDYMLNINNPADRSVADDVLAWLLATDSYGNRHAMARRLGVMYMIWNDRIWRSYNPDAGWQDYTGSNPHRDHIHFSFGWAGALKQTTWWTQAGPPNLGVLDYHLSDSVTSPVSTRPVIRYGQSPMVPIVGDWDGDGAETVSVYDPGAGAFLLSDDPATGSHQFLVRYGNPNAAPLVGDWDGDGRDNIGVRMGTTFFLRVSPITSTTETTTTVTFGGAGDIPVIGDWDGDGRDNVGVYVPALARFSLRTSANDAPETVRSLVYGNANVTPLAGDWDGDGRTNIGVRMGHIFFFRTSPITSGTETTVSIGYGNGDGREYPVTGDWDGDGRATQGIVF